MIGNAFCEWKVLLQDGSHASLPSVYAACLCHQECDPLQSGQQNQQRCTILHHSSSYIQQAMPIMVCLQCQRHWTHSQTVMKKFIRSLSLTCISSLSRTAYDPMLHVCLHQTGNSSAGFQCENWQEDQGEPCWRPHSLPWGFVPVLGVRNLIDVSTAQTLCLHIYQMPGNERALVHDVE